MIYLIVLAAIGGVLLGLGAAYWYLKRLCPEPAPQRSRALDRLYVVAPFYRDAELFVRWSGKDPQTFRIITREEQLLGLPQGIDVVFLTGNWHGQERNHTAFMRRLVMLQAKTRHVNLDQLSPGT